MADIFGFIIFLCVMYTLSGLIGYGVIEIVKRLYQFFMRLFKNGN